MASAKTTTDHQTIQQWVEKRGGHPARVKGTGSGDDPGILRIDYPGFSGEDTLEEIEWDDFFEAFEANQLAFLYQDQPKSRFSKFVSRDGAEDEEEEEEEAEELEEFDAVDLLESQHREVEELFEQIREAGTARERGRLFAELADQLAAHTKIEETIFYPKVCDEDTSELLHHAVEEHLAAKRVLAELLDLEPSDEQFMSKVAELEQLISEHVEEEETELFPQVREGDVDLVALGQRLEKRFADLIAAEPRTKVPKEIDAVAALPC
jgi:hemerythrin superfamily protein